MRGPLGPLPGSHAVARFVVVVEPNESPTAGLTSVPGRTGNWGPSRRCPSCPRLIVSERLSTGILIFK